MNLRYLFCLLALFVSFNSYALGLNDLSILIPLPKESEFSQMLSPAEESGNLLSKKVYDEFVALVPEHTNEVVWKNQLRVVAIRLDPCFIEGEGPLACRRQIRLVWQPVILDKKNKNQYTTRDAALHSFYEFSDDEFQSILQDWKTWAQTGNTLPIGVHPILKEEGLSGEHWKNLKSIILKYCNTQKIIRMTSMNVMANEQLWIFSGFDIHPNGYFEEMMIPRIKTSIQAITQSSHYDEEFWGGIRPMPKEDMEFNQLIDDSMDFRKEKKEVEVKKAIRSLFAFENPRIHDTASLDCVSCHATTMAHQWTERNYPQFNWNTDFTDVRYQSDFNLTNTAVGKVTPNRFRIFGYFENKPMISQRLINETAEVKLNLKLNFK